MAAYVKIAGVDIKHLLTAVIMTAPATLLLAKMLVPETGHPETEGDVKVEIEKPGVNVIDVGHALEAKLTQMSAEKPAGIRIDLFYDQIGRAS